MKKFTVLSSLVVAAMVGLVSVSPVRAADAMAPADSAKPMMKKHHKHKKMMADSTAMAAPAAAPADTAKPMKKHHKKKAMADSSAKM